MVGINRLPPFGGASGPGGMSSPENNRPQTPPPTPSAKALTDPGAMSSFISGSLSSWLAQNSSAYSPNDLLDLQRQVRDTAASLQNPSTSITESLSQVNDLMGQLGFPLSEGDMAQQMQTASSALDASAQKQLSSYNAKIGAVAEKVHGTGSASANETLEEMQESAQQLTSLASGISSAALSIEQLSQGVQNSPSASNMSDLAATFSSVTAQSDDFNGHMQGALAALPSQLSKIQADLKASEPTEVSATPATGAAAQVYNAVDQLWCLLIMRESEGSGSPPLPPNNLQNMYMMASAINNFLQGYNSSSSEANDPAAYHLYELIMTPENIGTTANPSYSSLGAICSGSNLNTAAQQLSSSYNSFFTNYSGPDNYTSVVGGIYNFLMSDNPNFFQMETSEGISAPSCSAPQGLTNALNQLMTDMTASPPNATTIAADITNLMSILPSNSSSTTYDGYVNFLQSYMNAPLDANGDSLASLASSGSGNLANFLSVSGIINDFSNQIGSYGTSIFGEILSLEGGT